MKIYNPKEPLISIHIPKCGGTTLEYVLQCWFNNNRIFPNLYNHPRILSVLWHARLDLLYQQIFGYGFVKHSDFHVKGYKPRKIRNRMFFDLRKIRKVPICIHGHFDPHGNYTLRNYYPGASQFLTFLRDPLQMATSMYYYRQQLMREGAHFKGKLVKRESELTLDDYLYNNKSYMFNSWPWEVNEKNYKNIIHENFVFIGIVEEFDDSIRRLAKILHQKTPAYALLNKTEHQSRIEPDRQVIERFKNNNALAYEIFNYVQNL